MKHRQANVVVTEASSPTAIQKHRVVNAKEETTTEASSPVGVARHKPAQKAKALPLKEQVSCSNGTQKLKGQSSGKIVSLEY
jgi:hypothetical protein